MTNTKEQSKKENNTNLKQYSKYANEQIKIVCKNNGFALCFILLCSIQLLGGSTTYTMMCLH